MTPDTGRVVTVEGPVAPETLGVTLPHEHVFHDGVDAWFTEPRSSHDRRLARQPVSLETLPYVRRHPMQHRDNMRLDSIQEAIDEVARFHRAGGDTIVDVTPKHLGDDPERVRAVARETGVTFVHGTAYYTRSIHPPHLADADPETVVGDLIADGHADRLLFSHDICTKIQRRSYGGFGYAHLLENVVPMLTGRGVDPGTIDRILVDNPRRLLTFDAPA